MSLQAKYNSKRHGFTLLEVVVVLVITAVVFGLLLRPIISSLSLTQEAQTLSEAQDSARKASAVLSKELGHATFVLDGMSHPFTFSTAPTVTAGTYDTYTNFLDIEVPTLANGRSVAHVYGAKLDFVLPRPTTTGFADPTTQQPITFQNSPTGSSTVETTAPSLLPLAPNTTLVRYFIGLLHPGSGNSPIHYSNSNAGLPYGTDSNNMYVLYRAQVPVTDSNGDLDTNYWVPTAATAGNNLNQQYPEFDDPDFFRIIDPNNLQTTDIEWFTTNHQQYTSGDAKIHDGIVDNWIAIAVPVVTAPNLDMLDLPKNANGQFDPSQYGSVDDLVSNISFPVATSSVSFTPTYNNGEVLTPSAASDNEDGQAAFADYITGLTYIPTTYSSVHTMWSSDASIFLYPGNYLNSGGAGGPNYTSQDFYVVQQTFVPGTGSPADVPGDLVEYFQGNPSKPAYNVTQGFAESTTTPYIPFTLDRDNGVIDFAVRPEYLTEVYRNAHGLSPVTYPYFQFAPTNTPLITGIDENSNNAEIGGNMNVANAFIVPGSLRVLASDGVAGPNLGGLTSYTLDPSGTAVPNLNQFSLTYPETPPTNVPVPTLTLSTPLDTATVYVSYLFQCNMSLTNTGSAASGSNPYIPYTVSATFESRNAIAVNMGIRIYRPDSSLSDLASYPSTIDVGNANH